MEGTPTAAWSGIAGNLYGTTQSFGAANYGVVFEVDASGHETVLHTFSGPPDGADSWAGLVRDPAGNLFGTTFAGGPLLGGTVFKVDTSGVETVLHGFRLEHRERPRSRDWPATPPATYTGPL